MAEYLKKAKEKPEEDITEVRDTVVKVRKEKYAK